MTGYGSFTSMKDSASDDFPVMPSPSRSNENSTCGSMLREWGADSSCHGIPRLAKAENIFLKLFWSIVVCGGTATTLYHFVILIQEFYSYPVSMVLNVSFVDTIAFPAVSICNLNRMRLSKLPLANGSFEHLLPATYGNTNLSDLEIAKNLANIRNRVDSAWNSLDRSLREELGHQITDMLLTCDFSGEPCSAQDFVLIHNAVYGNCFTFNFDQRTALKSHLPGPDYGLTLEILTEEAEIITELTEVPGIRLSVHDQQTMPFPEDDGLLISPNRYTMVAIQKEVVSRLPAPYRSQCWNLSREESMVYDVYPEYYDVLYSLKGCQRTCYQQHLISECHCFDPKVPHKGKAYLPFKTNDSVPLHPCSDRHDQCLAGVKGRYTHGTLSCDCRVVCKELILSYIISDSAWPQKKYKTLLYPLLADINTEIAGMTKSGIDPAGQLLRVQVFYEDLNYMQVVETEAYTTEKLLSDIGGTVGLYLGLSIAALFEFMELFGAIVTFAFPKTATTPVKDTDMKR